jgi:hypothetical protein
MLTQAELKRQLHYDPETGIFTWLVSNNQVKVGDVAGYLHDGYIRIGINQKQYMAHRLAHLYMEGYFPEHQMDHNLGIKDDNRWSEIKHVTTSCNMQNKKINKRNKSGFPGVSLSGRGKKWKSKIVIDKKHITLGYYKDPLEAALARFTVEQQCSKWTCNYRSYLVKAIKAVWPEFRFGKAIKVRKRTKWSAIK